MGYPGQQTRADDLPRQRPDGLTWLTRRLSALAERRLGQKPLRSQPAQEPPHQPSRDRFGIVPELKAKRPGRSRVAGRFKGLGWDWPTTHEGVSQLRHRTRQLVQLNPQQPAADIAGIIGQGGHEPDHVPRLVQQLHVVEIEGGVDVRSDRGSQVDVADRPVIIDSHRPVAAAFAGPAQVDTQPAATRCVRR